MLRLKLCVLAMLAALSASSYGEEAPDGARRFGQGGKPSEAQIAEWRTRRAAQNGSESAPAAAAAMPHRHDDMPAAAPAGKPEEAGHGPVWPGGMALGMRGGALWLSDTPPMRGEGGRGGMRASGMAGMEMGGGHGAPVTKRVWLRSGNDPLKSGFAHDDAEAAVESVLVTPRSKPEGEPLPAADGHKGLSFEMPAQGFYRLYLTSRKLQGDTLAVAVAKMEVGNFTHDGDEDEVAAALQAPRALDSAPLEIVRERKQDEKKFFQLKSGDEQAFFVLQKGLPLQGARVRFVSHQGWVKEGVSDEMGRVSFQLVRDYYPPWDEFQKRFKATYLVIAETGSVESGSFNGQPYSGVRYQSTLSGNYYPSPDDYQSYAWGLGIGMGMLMFCGVAVYLYRRRRVKPYREEHFDEQH